MASAFYTYNRDCWMFDKKLAQRRAYQSQAMILKTSELHREDIRDLVELTCSKMDSYLLINTFMICFCIRLLCAGRPEPGESPSWLHWLYAVSTAGGLLYFMVSVWLAMHASVSSHSIGVWMLTRDVRLSVPTEAQIDALREEASGFEASGENYLRVPLWQAQAQAGTEAGGGGASSSSDAVAGAGAPPVGARRALSSAELGRDDTMLLAVHVQRFRRAAANWQAHDAFARVCMTNGACQMLFAMSYFSLYMFVNENKCIWPAVCCCATFFGCAFLVLRLDLWLTARQFAGLGLLFGSAPFLALILNTINLSAAPDGLKHVANKFLPLIFAIHILWIYVAIQIARPEREGKVMLPTTFRAVLHLDVYNWLNSENADRQGVETTGEVVDDAKRKQLKAFFNEKQAEVGRTLNRFEHASAQDVLIKNKPFVQRVKACRRQLDNLARYRFDDAGELLEARREKEPEWLRLSERHGGQQHEFFYRRGAEGSLGGDQVVLRLPEEVESVDLYDVEWQIEELVARAAELHGLSQQAVLAGDVQGEDMGAVQDASTADGGRLRSGTFSNPMGTRGASQGDNRPEQPKPGQLPWWTFQQGSVALILVWTFGLLWSILTVLRDDPFALTSVHPEAFGVLKGAARSPELLLSGASLSPRLHFNPRGVSCHSSWGPALLIHEKYGVHRLLLEDTGEKPGFWSAPANATLEPALGECLSQTDESFQLEGILGVAIRCSAQASGEGSSCHALLLGGEGRRLARCSLGQGGAAREAAEHAEPGWTEVRGGPWRALAADEQVAWALSGSTLVQLRPGLGREEQLLPQAEISSRAVNTSRLHALPGGKAVLGVETQGLLNVWFTEDLPQLVWKLPASTRWAGVCATDTALYYVGVGRRSGELNVWRSALPTELASLTPRREQFGLVFS